MEKTNATDHPNAIRGEQAKNDNIEKIAQGEELDRIKRETDDGGTQIRVEETTPPNAKEPVKVYTDGYAQINIGKINIYIRGKVELDVVKIEQRIKELEDIRKKGLEEFTKSMNEELKSCKQRLHNYQRSMEMSNTLNNAGIEDNDENNLMIVRNLLDAAKEVTDERTEVKSYIKGTEGKVEVVSRWKITSDGKPYLATVILKPVK